VSRRLVTPVFSRRSESFDATSWYRSPPGCVDVETGLVKIGVDQRIIIVFSRQWLFPCAGVGDKIWLRAWTADHSNSKGFILMATSQNDLEKRLTQLTKEVPTRGLERHPLILKNITDLADELKSPAVTALAASQTIQTIIAFPPQIQRGWHYVPKQALLFTPTNAIHIMASIWPDQEPRVTTLKGSGLMYIEVTLVLLYGSLEILAQGLTVPTRLGVEFNTVAWEQLSRPLRQLLQATRAATGAPKNEPAYSPAVQQALEALPLKFSNGAKIYGLLPGEELEDLTFQPGNWKRWLFLFRRPISANTLLLLTSNYVVVIREELEVSWGWIIAYIPRNGVVGMQNQPHGEWNEITVQLVRGDQKAEYKILLKNEAAQAWRARWIQHGGQWTDLPAES
jgi:hypothetical protein